MAQLTGGTLFPISFGTNLFADQFDSLQIEDWLSGTASAQTATGFTMSLPASLDIQYTGTNFAYDGNGNVIDGNITGLSITSPLSGELWLAFDDIHISVVDFQTCVVALNTPEFLSFILAASDTLLGAVGADHADILNGFDGNDSVNGGGGDDTLVGDAGNDTLDGGRGGDRLFGGSGDDTYLVDGSLDVLDETNGSGLDTVVLEGEFFDLSRNSYGDIENIDIVGAVYRAVAYGNDLGNRIVSSREHNFLQGLGGNDTLIVADGNDIAYGGSGDDSIDGAGGNDELTGGIGNDTLIGGDGNDSLFGDGGADILQGGTGDDRYYIDSGDIVAEALAGTAGGVDSVVHFGGGAYILGANLENLYAGTVSIATGNGLNNNITLGAGNNRIFGLEGDDSLNGASGNDTLNGGSGNDTLMGGTGADVLSGGAGNDRYWVESAADRISGEVRGAAGGFDTITSTVSRTLGTNIENLILDGADAIDGTGNSLSNRISGNDSTNRLSGLGGADELFGEAGNDRLNGGAGNDTLIGGFGNDTLIGGTGNDEFRYASVIDGYDIIAGFDGLAAGGQDHLDLDGLLDELGLATDDRAGLVQLTDGGAQVDVRIDTDGDGAFELLAATLQTRSLITAGNTVSDDVILGTL